MPSITLKEIPEDLHARLEREATANFRSLDQEVLARIQRSFEFEEHASARTIERLVQEAIDSGVEEPLSREKFDAARRKAREAFASRDKAA